MHKHRPCYSRCSRPDPAKAGSRAAPAPAWRSDELAEGWNTKWRKGYPNPKLRRRANRLG